MTRKSFELLHLLVKNAGHLVKKERLINEIWSDAIVEDSNISQQIYLLRKILGSDENGNPLIQTKPKRGYFFAGQVRKVEEPAKADAPADEPTPAAEIDAVPVVRDPSPANAAGQARTNKFRATPRLIGAIFSILIAVLLVGGGFFYWRSQTPAASQTGIGSIAVLPFRRIGQHPDDSKIEFGLADAVINNLSKQQKIPVRSMSAVFQYADKSAFDPIEAGKELGVDSVLEGTVQRDGDQLRVSLRLLKIADGSTIWAEIFTEKSAQLFSLQDSISAKVAQSLSMNIAGWEKPPAAAPPANAEAFQFYQLGVYFSNTRTAEGMNRAIGYFQKVTEIDPAYAPAHAMLADSYNWLNEFEAGGRKAELLDKSEAAAQRALALDNGFAEAHIAMAFVQLVKYKDYEGGRNSLRRAVELAPFNPTARLHYGWDLLQRGDLENSYRQIVLAQEYSPLSAHNNLTLCSLLLFRRDYPQALKFCRKSAELQPSTPMVNIQIANLLFLMNRADEAINLLMIENSSRSQRFLALGSLGYIYARTGRREDAEKIYRQLNESPETPGKYGDLALLAATLGKKSEALDHFRTLLEKSAIKPNYLLFDPFWEVVFRDDDFRRLLAQPSTETAPPSRN